MNNSNSNRGSVSAGFLTLPMLRDLSIICAVLTILYKLLTSEFSINFSDFSFNDFLALVLALFSIWLSTAFYFKANEAANQFYHNTFEFTQQTSVILGRIESGFSEKFNSINTSISALEQRRRTVEMANTEIAETDEAGQKIIKELIEKSHLDAQEKISLAQQLNALKAERDRALERLNSTIARSESENISQTTTNLSAIFALRSLVSQIPLKPDGKIDEKQLDKTFYQYIYNCPTAKRSSLLRSGFITEEGDLSEKGRSFIQNRIKAVNRESDEPSR